MRETSITCDRCGRKREAPDAIVHASHTKLPKISFCPWREEAFIGNFVGALSRIPADLCDACAASLKDWWIDGRGDAK